MNRTLKEATVRRYHDTSHAHLRRHVANLVNVHNYARRLRPLKGPDPLRIPLQNLDERAATLYTRPAPPNAGNKQIV